MSDSEETAAAETRSGSRKREPAGDGEEGGHEAKKQRTVKYVYKPEMYLDADGNRISNYGDYRRGLTMAQNAKKCAFREDMSEHDNGRMRRYLTRRFRGDPVSFFKKWDLDDIVYDHKEEWAVDKNETMAFAIFVQFTVYVDNETAEREAERAKNADKRIGMGLVKKRLNLNEVRIAQDKKSNLIFNPISLCQRRLRQLSSRRRSKARTLIDCIAEVYNYSGEPLSAEMFQELWDAKCSEPHTSVQDNQLLGIVKFVVASILRGDKKYLLVVYEILLGNVGKICAPQTHRYLISVLDECENAAVLAGSVAVASRAPDFAASPSLSDDYDEDTDSSSDACSSDSSEDEDYNEYDEL